VVDAQIDLNSHQVDASFLAFTKSLQRMVAAKMPKKNRKAGRQRGKLKETPSQRRWQGCVARIGAQLWRRQLDQHNGILDIFRNGRAWDSIVQISLNTLSMSGSSAEPNPRKSATVRAMLVTRTGTPSMMCS